MLKKFLPKENRFFTLFNQHTDMVVEGILLFESMLDKYSQKDSMAIRLKEIENSADDIAHQIFELLNTVFITPFDREDIQMLTHHLDDIMDMVEKAGIRMVIYNILSPPATVRKQTDILKKAFLELATAIKLLVDLKHKERIRNICIHVNSIENEGDAELRMGLKALFNTPGIDPLELIKKKEIFELLEAAIDRCEDLANVLETILIKYA